MFLSGKDVAGKIFLETKKTIQDESIVPGLAVILVGDDPSSHLYVSLKEKRAEELGIYFVKKILPKEITADEIKKTISELNMDETIHGIIVQLPLPASLPTDEIIASIEPHKDTDGFHPETIKKFLAGDQERLPVFPRAMIALLREAPKCERSEALALVNSTLLGKVLEKALTNEGYSAKYHLGKEKQQIRSLAEEKDVIFLATGEANTLSVLHCKEDAVIIDGGISYDEKGKVIGDVARDDGVYREDVFVTPVPGGVGPVTVAVLLARVTEAALREKSL